MLGAAIVVTTLNQLTISIVMITIRYFWKAKKLKQKKLHSDCMTSTQDNSNTIPTTNVHSNSQDFSLICVDK